jgi:hypothetical protein
LFLFINIHILYLLISSFLSNLRRAFLLFVGLLALGVLLIDFPQVELHKRLIFFLSMTLVHMLLECLLVIETLLAFFALDLLLAMSFQVHVQGVLPKVPRAADIALELLKVHVLFLMVG